ncbi:DUF2267 domain-containing protein [Sinorhizobium prairiense]|uniref:DUF2267 domain-containing protein n=1 Tax=unclassified Sinorhizobium TaxID=2613772 RepID=UPI0023D7C33C|nr:MULTISPECIES: DUF2267 domain-containing protein [unclassified Sinorhizobium]WEJ08570.1 DUF2267 domain-containing protein [Sinorhizobium sp. M103]WEJ13926.1 DUF2267 domain-containing protein [Sinorhizobium sp. K101]WEJ35529.1 DUF2267 domain-containing protein [Sinorhizobium sp. C101]
MIGTKGVFLAEDTPFNTGECSMSLSHDLDSALQTTQNWISDLMWRLRWDDRERVYQALIATLHALRDCLDRDEAVFIGPYLPPLLRGFYYEGWYDGRRAIARNRNSFLDRVHDGVERDPAVEPEEVARSVPFAYSRAPRCQGRRSKSAA